MKTLAESRLTKGVKMFWGLQKAICAWLKTKNIHLALKVIKVIGVSWHRKAINVWSLFCCLCCEQFYMWYFCVCVFLVLSQPLVMCRQCPGYRREVSQMLFASGSSYWLPGLPAPPPIPPPPKPATEEGSAKPTGEQPSTSSDIPSGDYECPLNSSLQGTAHSVFCDCKMQIFTS